MEYNKYMQSKAWDKKRKLRLKYDDYTCQSCSEKDKPLDVHHITYDRFGYERMSDLESLCRRCHEVKHWKRASIVFEVCRTCGDFLAIFVRKIILLGQTWTQYTCQDGHIRSYKD